MLTWFAETTLVALILAAIAMIAGHRRRLGPAARHAFWLVVLLKLLAPPVVTWPRPSWLAWPTPAPVSVVADAVPIPAVEAVEIAVAEVVAGARPRIPHPHRAARAEGARPPAPAKVETAMVVVDPEPAPEPAILAPAPDSAAIGRMILLAWGAASASLVVWQIARIMRFRRCLRWALPAPKWLEGEARHIGREMGVAVPEILVVPKLVSPMLWFLGRPKLLIPDWLIAALGDAGWRGVLAHEMAHLRRRDHWVRRLELIAGLIWWWNPLYWLTRRRLEAEAELACDEWAVRIFPKGRLALAEALLEVCQSLPAAKPPAPALGVAGSGRFLERRVAMILSDQAPSRATIPALFGAALLALLALPGWSASIAAPPEPPAAPAATDDGDEDEQAERAAEEAEEAAEAAEKTAEAMEEAAEAAAEAAERAAEAVAEAAERAAEAAAEAAEAAAEAAEEAAERAAEAIEAATEAAEDESSEGADGEDDGDEGDDEKARIDPARLKELEVLGKKIGVEMEAKFGPGSEFQKQMEKQFGPGSEFQKQIEKQFGPGSEFEEVMKKQFGPGSEFEKQMKGQFGPGSEFEKQIKKFKADAKKAGKHSQEPEVRGEAQATVGKPKEARKAKEQPASESKAQRIKKLQAQIDAISAELRALAEEDEDN